MDHVEIAKSIQAKKLKPIYLFHGEEAYYIDKLADFIADTVLTPAEKDFNLTIFYGKDAKPENVIDSCRRYPMFAEYSIVMLREAQMMTTRGSELDLLETYAENPLPNTILVICYKGGKYDARKKLYKYIKQHGLIYESTSLKENEVPAVIENYLKRKNAAIETDALELLLQYLGTHLQKIFNEVDKLIINVKQGKKISVQDIEKYIGISKDYNIYALQSALILKNYERAFIIANYINKTPKTNPFVLTLSNIHSAYQKLYLFILGGGNDNWDLFRQYQIHSSQANDYKKAKHIYTLQEIEHIFGVILEYDLRSKGVHNGDASDAQLLKELVFKIMNCQHLQ